MRNLRQGIRRIIKEEMSKGSFSKNIVAYHRSNTKFYDFNISYASNSKTRQYVGYGLYFSNVIPIEHWGDYLYKVKISNVFLIHTDTSVEGWVVDRIAKALNDNSKMSDELVKFSYNGYLFYKTLSRILGNDKRASAFLFANGIDGLMKTRGKDYYDYVLFNDDCISIEEIKYDPY